MAVYLFWEFGWCVVGHEAILLKIFGLAFNGKGNIEDDIRLT